MEDLEIVKDITENAEHTAEETPKTYTEDQINEIVNTRVDELLPGKLARKEARIRKETDREYKEIMDYLRAATGKESVSDIKAYMREHYGEVGIKPKEEPEYSQADLAVLAGNDAKSIISGGYDEAVEEHDRLEKLGANMTARERAVHAELAEYRKQEEQGRELEKIGVPREVFTSKEFRDFAGMFDKSVPITKVYETFAKNKKPEVQTMGSVTTVDSGDGGIKDFYTQEEAAKFSHKELLANPNLLAAVLKSQSQWM